MALSCCPSRKVTGVRNTITHFSTVNGLAATFENVVQDDRGYIWLATINGLQRYDGNNFLIFTHDPDDPNSILQKTYFTYKDRKEALDRNYTIASEYSTENFKYLEKKVEWQGTPTYFSEEYDELSDGTLFVVAAFAFTFE
jgi:hypothetical protein